MDVKNVADNKKFWKTAKPFFSDKGAAKSEITLIEGDKIIQEDSEIAKIMNEFFSKAVESLKINIPNEYIIEESVSDDAIENIITKYSNHPSIKLINENVVKGCFSFNLVNLTDIIDEVKALDSNKATISGSIPPKFLQENCDVCCKPLVKIINDAQ